MSLTPRGRGLFVVVSWIKDVTGELEVKVPEHAQCRARDDSDKQTFTAKLMYQIYVYLHESLFILVSTEDTFSFIWINRSKEETNSIKQICAITITKQITFPNTRLRYLNMFLLWNKCTDCQFCYLWRSFTTFLNIKSSPDENDIILNMENVLFLFINLLLIMKVGHSVLEFCVFGPVNRLLEYRMFMD